MKFYTLDTLFSFRKNSRKIIREIIEIDPDYVDWCAINLDHFYIANEIITEVNAINPSFIISEEG